MTKHSTFEEKYIVDPVKGCFVWQRSKSKWGYGHVRYNGKWMPAHRVSYEMAKGPIPDGLTIDHLCRNPACVKPEHLEAVTIKENTMRGTSPSAKNAVKTHCKNNHEFNEENTYFHKGQRRTCRACNKASVYKYKRSKINQ